MIHIRECMCTDDHRFLTLLHTAMYDIDSNNHVVFSVEQCLNCKGVRGVPHQNMELYVNSNSEEAKAFREMINYITEPLPLLLVSKNKVKDYLMKLKKRLFHEA